MSANTNKIEKIQERALRFIYNDSNSTYENLLIVSKLPTLKVRRLRTMAIEAKTHSKTYLKNIPKIFQEYFKNTLKIFMQNSQALK
jgi:hypothetical protein